uniref:Uncharacterized protein n=1 Tax=Timema bartmani TaxID=61472 RepID=A0A7R9EV61_9NEOP|nr:unnamed protein product [Timema bartmani]
MPRIITAILASDIISELRQSDDITQFGWFHLLVLFVCGSTFLSVTLVPNVLTYMSDDVGCDLGLSLQDKSTTNDITYTGLHPSCTSTLIKLVDSMTRLSSVKGLDSRVRLDSTP